MKSEVIKKETFRKIYQNENYLKFNNALKKIEIIVCKIHF